MQHCRRRPWEPHKYPSREAQDSTLAMLLGWVSEHYRREGAMSFAAHAALHAGYAGRKLILRDSGHALEELGLLP